MYKRQKDARADGAALGPPGPAVGHSLTHFPAQMKGLVLLRSAALISHSSLQLLECFGFAFGAEEERYLAIWKFGRDCCKSAQINCEGELWENCVLFGKSTVAEGFL